MTGVTGWRGPTGECSCSVTPRSWGHSPGIGVHVHDIVGIVPTANDLGYFLVGRDGGVFAFGNAPFIGSLPGRGTDVDDIVGIATSSE